MSARHLHQVASHLHSLVPLWTRHGTSAPCFRGSSPLRVSQAPAHKNRRCLRSGQHGCGRASCCDVTGLMDRARCSIRHGLHDRHTHDTSTSKRVHDNLDPPARSITEQRLRSSVLSSTRRPTVLPRRPVRHSVASWFACHQSAYPVAIRSGTAVAQRLAAAQWLRCEIGVD